MLQRRAFLCSATIAAATAAVGPTARRTRIPCGMLGIDHAHGLDVLRVLRASPDFELVGVSEPDDAVCRRVSLLPEAQGVEWLSQDQLLSDPSVAMIAVESGVSRLVPLARAAVDAGKHVHMDKPAGASLVEFEALLHAAETKSRLFQMGYMFRYNPGFDFVRRAAKEGWLGEVYSISASICTDLDAEKRARIGTFSGGIMFELGCHLIDMAVLLLGAPNKVTSFVRHDGPQQDPLADNALAVLEYPRAMVHIESAAMEFNAFPARRFKIAGTKGSIVLNPLEPPAAQLRLREPAGGYGKGNHAVSFADVERHVRDFADLAACIRGEHGFAYSTQHDRLVHKTVLHASGMLPSA